jgi:hypothetical protein
MSEPARIPENSGIVERVSRPGRAPLYKITVTSLILLLGALEGWFKRTDFSTDAISYLDISRAIPVHEWKMVFNPLWSVGYPLLLAMLRPLFPQTPDGEWIAIHVLNFAIFIGAWLAFLYLLRSFDPLYEACSEEDAARRRKFVFLAGACIFASIQLCIDSVSRVGPDLLVSAFFFVATAMVVRLLTKSSYGLAISLGVVLGLGYWTKGIFLALAGTLLVVLAAALFFRKRSFVPVLLSAVIFAVMVLPYAMGLSWSFGHFTLGESGPLNYAFHVNYLPRWTNWQGEPGGLGTPIHPTHQLMKNPDLFAFGEPYHNTYPPFGNVVYWYQGYRHFWNAKNQAVGIGRDLVALAQVFVKQPIFYALLLSVVLIFRAVPDRGKWLRTVAHFWHFYLAAVVGVLLYVQVHLEDRYLGSFFAILCLLPFVTLAMVRAMPSRKAQAWILAMMGAGSILNYAVVDRDVLAHIRSHYTYAENSQWKLGLALEHEGLKPGDAVGVVGGPNAACTWAYVAHLHIVAELGGEPYDQHHALPESAESVAAKFWNSSPALQQQVVSLFQQAGATAVVAAAKPAEIEAPHGWKQLPGTDEWIYRFE